MKVTLEFDLPEQEGEYKNAIQGGMMASLIYEFTNDIRGKAKHGITKPKDWDEVKSLWWEFLQDYKIDPYEG